MIIVLQFFEIPVVLILDFVRRIRQNENGFRVKKRKGKVWGENKSKRERKREVWGENKREGEKFREKIRSREREVWGENKNERERGLGRK